MKAKRTLFIGLLVIFSGSQLWGQGRCWNDKKVPKEWFVTALGGYTFSYGNERPYWNRDKMSLVSNEKFDVYNVNNARGWTINGGLGVYLNKNLGLQLSINYLIGHNYQGSASEAFSFSESWYSNNELTNMDGYSAVANFSYRVRTLSAIPSLLYKFHFKKLYVFASLGLCVAVTKNLSNTSTHKQVFLNQKLVKERSYQSSINAWRKDAYIVGIYSGLGVAYPLNLRFEILIQTLMKTQQLVGDTPDKGFPYNDNYQLDGVEVSMGIKYNLFTSRLDAE